MREHCHNAHRRKSLNRALELSSPAMCITSKWQYSLSLSLSLSSVVPRTTCDQRLLVLVKSGMFLTHRHVHQSRCIQAISSVVDGFTVLLDGGGPQRFNQHWLVFLGVTTPGSRTCIWSTCAAERDGGGVERATSLSTRISETTVLVMASFKHLGGWAVHPDKVSCGALAIPQLGKHTARRQTPAP